MLKVLIVLNQSMYIQKKIYRLSVNGSNDVKPIGVDVEELLLHGSNVNSLVVATTSSTSETIPTPNL